MNWRVITFQYFLVIIICQGSSTYKKGFYAQGVSVQGAQSNNVNIMKSGESAQFQVRQQQTSGQLSIPISHSQSSQGYSQASSMQLSRNINYDQPTTNSKFLGIVHRDIEENHSMMENNNNDNNSLTEEEIILIKQQLEQLDSQNYSDDEINQFWKIFSEQHHIDYNDLNNYIHKKIKVKQHKISFTPELINLIEQQFKILSSSNYNTQQTLQFWADFSTKYHLDMKKLLQYVKKITIHKKQFPKLNYGQWRRHQKGKMDKNIPKAFS